MYKYDVFISHSHKDKRFANKLARDIIEAGYNVFLSETSLDVGDSFAAAITDAIKRSKFVIVVMSPDYFASEWAEKEWQAAMLEELSQTRIKVIPLMYRDCDVAAPLYRKQWVDFREQYPKGLKFLLSGLRDLSSDDSLKATDAQPTTVSPAIGQAVETLDPATLSELTKVLKKAVQAFESKPKELSINQAKSTPSVVEEDLCFVVMPFGSEELNIVYEYFVKPVLEEVCNLRSQRGDDVFGSNIIMDDIKNSINKSRLLVADLTGRNANVFYEVGIAHTLNKPVLLLAQSIDDVPFDLRHRRVLLYEYSPRGCKKLEKDLRGHIQSMLESSLS